MMKTISKLFRKFLLFTIAFLTALNTVTIVMQVFMRYFFKTSIAWTNELAGISLAWITFLGAALLTADEAHIGMDMIIKKLKPGARLTVKLVINILCLIVCYVMVVYGVQTVKTGMNSKLIALPATLGQALIIIPVSGFMMAAVIVINSVRDVKKFVSSEAIGEIPVEAEALYDDVPEEVRKRAEEAFEDEESKGGDK